MIFHKQIEKIYKARVFSRYDDTGLVKYFSHKDFSGLRADPYSFNSSKGHKLKGYFYSYENSPSSPLVVFDHGLGGGHTAYTKEIEMLCSHGYTVFSYDHTGCMESEGESAGGLSQSLCDLDDCINALKTDESIDTSRIYVMGHSWGGFATLNITALHPDIEKTVVLSGFISVPDMVAQNFPSPLTGYRKHILALEKESNPSFADISALDTLSKTSANALLIYSDNDSMVSTALHYDKLKDALCDKENISFILEHGKGHNPNYTTDAVANLAKLTAGLKGIKKLDTPEKKEAFRNSFDWHKMTEQDTKVWDKIFEHLDK